jgi:hypothetical protein
LLVPEYIGIDLNILTGQKSFVFQMERLCLHSSRMMKMKHDEVGNFGRNSDVDSEELNGPIRCVSVVTEVDRCTQSDPSGQTPARKKSFKYLSKNQRAPIPISGAGRQVAIRKQSIAIMTNFFVGGPLIYLSGLSMFKQPPTKRH